jgi:hypothetical protein
MRQKVASLREGLSKALEVKGKNYDDERAEKVRTSSLRTILFPELPDLKKGKGGRKTRRRR